MQRVYSLTALLLMLLFFLSHTVGAGPVISDGSDGPFAPSTSLVTLNMEDLAPDGIFNFTSIMIPAGTTVRFIRNSANTPVFFAATEQVEINGTIEVSAWVTDIAHPQFAFPELPKRSGGPGGFDGGKAGTSSSPAGEIGAGPGGGQPGLANGSPGGGGGHAQEGGTADRYGPEPGPGGSSQPYPDPLSGGSGGGGGSVGYCFGVPLDAGPGGGGGGALQIASAKGIAIRGSILANGANGSWAFANVFNSGGPGGGGSGGTIELFAPRVFLDQTGSLRALGGFGGGLSTQQYTNDPEYYSSHADGGQGYLHVQADQVALQGEVNGTLILVEICGADFDADGDVDGSDLAAFASDFGRTDCLGSRPCEGDFDADGDVDGSDLAAFASDFGRTDCP